jgi:hypothetical protein
MLPLPKAHGEVQKRFLYKKFWNICCLLFQEENSFISEDGVNSCDSFMTADAANHSQSADRSTGSSSARKKEAESKSNGRILYCAPTGKAASVIKKRVGKKAFTIHQVWIVIIFLVLIPIVTNLSILTFSVLS